MALWKWNQDQIWLCLQLAFKYNYINVFWCKQTAYRLQIVFFLFNAKYIKI